MFVFALAGCVFGGTTGPTSGPSVALPTNSSGTSRSALPMVSGESSPQNLASGVGLCSLADIDITLVSDRAEYRVGEPVSLTATATNSGNSLCNLPTGNCLPQIQIADSTGRVVWDRAATAVVCTFRTPVALAPGSTTVQSVVWDGTVCAGRTPESCPGQPVSAGTYQSVAEWDGASGTTSIIVAA
jgi:hypothetical protein